MRKPRSEMLYVSMLIRLLVIAALCACASAAEPPWQQIAIPSTSEIAAKFRTPPSEYGVILWWGWDGPISGAQLIFKAALDHLRQFANLGGRVIFVGGPPSLVADRNILSAVSTDGFTWARVEASSEITEQILKTLPIADVELDQNLPAVKYLHRRLKNADLYFFFNESDQTQFSRVSIEGSGEAQLWNARTGEISPLHVASQSKNKVQLSLELQPYESEFIVLNH